MLDATSLRIAFAVLALTLMALFYFVTYRTTRAAYAGWWCASLGLFLLGASALLLDGTSQQVWSNPLSNVLLLLGAGCVWGGARSLRGVALKRWQLAVAPAIVAPLSVIDDPAHNTWSGGPFFLGGMCALLVLAAVDLWRRQENDPSGNRPDRAMYELSLRSITVGCTLVAIFYVGRWTAFVTLGPDHSFFETYFGGGPTTLLTTVMLATVSFSMSTLSDEQQKATLRELAARDGLTGLFNRTEFMRLAGAEMRRMGREHRQGELILADLDQFKRINDEQGHLAGDRAIVTFAEACMATVRATDLVGRYGGEEFIMLLPGASPDRATQVTDAIDAAMRLASKNGDGPRLPTVSYGIATVDDTVDLERAIGHADAALYRAKAAGRNRTVHYLPGAA